MVVLFMFKIKISKTRYQSLTLSLLIIFHRKKEELFSYRILTLLTNNKTHTQITKLFYKEMT